MLCCMSWTHFSDWFTCLCYLTSTFSLRPSMHDSFNHLTINFTLHWAAWSVIFSRCSSPARSFLGSIRSRRAFLSLRKGKSRHLEIDLQQHAPGSFSPVSTQTSAPACVPCFFKYLSIGHRCSTLLLSLKSQHWTCTYQACSLRVLIWPPLPRERMKTCIRLPLLAVWTAESQAAFKRRLKTSHLIQH